jgi:glycerol-3-phosphate acyltransferase PlsY
LTLIADVAKGWLPVFLAHQLEMGLSVASLAGVAAFLGHLYSLFLRFEGGKGVATAFGVFLALAPLPTLVSITVFAVVFASSRLVSLGSMSAAAAAPLSFWILGYPPPITAAAAFIAVMVIWRHRGNIRRLWAGTEPKFSASNSR